MRSPWRSWERSNAISAASVLNALASLLPASMPVVAIQQVVIEGGADLSEGNYPLLQLRCDRTRGAAVTFPQGRQETHSVEVIYIDSYVDKTLTVAQIMRNLRRQLDQLVATLATNPQLVVSTTLAASALAGATQVTLSSALGFFSPLAIDLLGEQPNTVAAADPWTSGVVTLSEPLANNHNAGETVTSGQNALRSFTSYEVQVDYPATNDKIGFPVVTAVLDLTVEDLLYRP